MRYLSISEPPEGVFSLAFAPQLQDPAAEWVIGRVCLTNRHLARSAEACLSIFPELSGFVPSSNDVNFRRLAFHSLEDIDAQLKQLTPPFYAHFFPVLSTRPPMSCVQIYAAEEGKAVIIGHKMARELTQEEHGKLLQWAESAREFEQLPALAGKTLHFLLLCSCRQNERAEIADQKDFVEAWKTFLSLTTPPYGPLTAECSTSPLKSLTGPVR